MTVECCDITAPCEPQNKDVTAPVKYVCFAIIRHPIFKL